MVAIDLASAQRANLVAAQTRLGHTIHSLDSAAESLYDAESRIVDADLALETMRLAQADVLQQAEAAMLARANSAPQSILELLG
jgi:flagellin